jgi:TatD DNase family protein
VKFIDIHTHRPIPELEVIAIYNILFGHEIPNLSHKNYSIGLHPWYLSTVSKSKDLENLRELGNSEKILAIGEIGLDRLCKTDFDLQLEIFEQQIKIANQLKKPIIIHCVRAFSELIAIKKKLKPSVPIVIHGFNQNIEILNQLLKNDFYFSIGHSLLINNANAIKAISIIPKSRLFFETDTANDISIIDIYIKASQILQLELNELKNIIFKNFETVFSEKRI